MTPMHYSIAALAFVLASGCRYTEQKPLASGGTRLQTGSSATDSGMPPGGEDGGGEPTGAPPVLETVAGEWTEDTEGSWYVLGSLAYTDEDDDVRVGGKVGVTIVVDGDTFSEEWFEIDGEQAVHDEESNAVFFNPRPPGVTDPVEASIELTIRLKDAGENFSNEQTITPEPPSGP